MAGTIRGFRTCKFAQKDGLLAAFFELFFAFQSRKSLFIGLLLLKIKQFVFYFQLKNDPKGLPKVKGGDDAATAFWLPLAELDATMMFEDHYAIITKMVGLQLVTI